MINVISTQATEAYIYKKFTWKCKGLRIARPFLRKKKKPLCGIVTRVD